MEAEAGRLLGSPTVRGGSQRRVGELRVGDQQLVEIAKALSLEAGILVMDEPTNRLDHDRSGEALPTSRGSAQGVTILYVSHKMDEVFELADRITVLRDGDSCGPSANGNHASRNNPPDGGPRN